MNTTQRILHQFRYDLRSNRVAIVALLLLCAAFAISERQMFGFPQAFALFVLVSGMLSIITLAITFTNDPAVGHDAFWKTRPLRGKEMVGSKLLMLLVLYVPLAIAWAGLPWLAYGKDGGAYYIHEFWLTSTPAAAATIAAASFSKRLPTFGILLTGLIAITCLAIMVTFQAAPSVSTIAIRRSSLMLAFGIFLVGAIVVATLQYLRGYRHLHVGILVAFIVFGSICHSQLKIDFITKTISQSESAELGLDRMTVNLLGTSEGFESGTHQHNFGSEKTIYYKTVMTPISFSRLPADQFVESISVREGVLAGNPSIPQLDSTLNQTFDRRSSSLAKIAYPDHRILSNRGIESPEQITLLKLEEAEYLPLVGKTFRFEASAECAIAKIEKIGSVPFGERGVVESPEYRFEINSKKESGRIRYRVEGRMRAHMGSKTNPFESPQAVLVNPTRKEVIFQSGGGGGPSNSRYFYRQMTYQPGRTFTYRKDRESERERVEITDEWLAESEVVLFVRKKLGNIEIPLKVEDFVIP